MKVRRAPVENGVVSHNNIASSEATSWDYYQRARCWVAVVTPARFAPGGLERCFLERARRPGHYIAAIGPGDVLEVAADELSCSGRRKRRHREYMKVLTVEIPATGEGVVSLSKSFETEKEARGVALPADGASAR